MKDTLKYWLTAFHLKGVGPRTFFTWLDQFANIIDLFTADVDEYQAKGFLEDQISELKSIKPGWIEKDLQWAQLEGNAIISFDDPDYPPLLKQISDPPLVLFIKGNKQALSQTQIAIVGSRRPTPSGIKNAEHFAAELAKEGYAITSGLAAGIDGASHRGALAAKGVTLAVAGTGLNHVYPLGHRNLAQQILENNGALVSEFALSLGPMAQHFPRRNRIISGLSRGVLVVEAAIKSGSLVTARHALEQNREVFAIPGSIHNALARGCHHLIRQGAKLVESADDILEELGSKRTIKVQNTFGENLLSPVLQALLNQIDYEITPIDVILLRTQLPASEISSNLLILELNGYIQTVSGGYIRV